MAELNKKKHFYLIDGSGYIFRAYYALPPLSRKSDGLPTGAVAGFCNMLFKLLEDAKSKENKQKPTHFVVIFDSARKNFRNDIYEDYKANRSDAPDDLIPQFEYIRKSVEAFNIPAVEMINYEADDLIATYSKQITKLGSDVTIVSSDKDLMQLHDKKVRIYDPKVIDVQSLAGDSSDNVPGVPGIGVKTAAELINKFGSLEELLKNAETIKQNKRRETIIENKDKALISKKLVTLKKDVPVKNKLDDFLLKEIDKKKLFNFLRDMEFNRLLSSAISTYGEIDFENENKEQAQKTKDNLSKSNYNLIKSEDELKKLIHKIEEVGELAIDTETNSLNPHLAKLVGISISFKIGEAYYVPLNHSNGKNLDEKNILKILKPLLEDKTIKKILNCIFFFQ